MKTSRIFLATGTLAFLTALSSGASALTSAAPVNIQRGDLDGHAYQSGGYGEGEEHAIEQAAKDYALHITTSVGPHNEYTGPVKLQIENKAGQSVFALDGAGPLTNVNLAPGAYRVKATYGKTERVAAVVIKPGAHQVLHLHWASAANA